jgi:hypothetical protein
MSKFMLFLKTIKIKRIDFLIFFLVEKGRARIALAGRQPSLSKFNDSLMPVALL